MESLPSKITSRSPLATAAGATGKAINSMHVTCKVCAAPFENSLNLPIDKSER